MRRLPFAVLVGVALVALAVTGTAAAKKGPKPPKPPKPAKTETVQILAVNDFHGNLEPPQGSSGRISTGPSTTVDAGGAEYVATHVKNLEEGWKYSYLVSAGDLVGASPLLSGLFHDEPTIEAFNAMDLDFNGVGNHEFDEGTDELRRSRSAVAIRWTVARTATPFYGSDLPVPGRERDRRPDRERRSSRRSRSSTSAERRSPSSAMTLEGTPEIVA